MFYLRTSSASWSPDSSASTISFQSMCSNCSSITSMLSNHTPAVSQDGFLVAVLSVLDAVSRSSSRKELQTSEKLLSALCIWHFSRLSRSFSYNNVRMRDFPAKNPPTCSHKYPWRLLQVESLTWSLCVRST